MSARIRPADAADRPRILEMARELVEALLDYWTGPKVHAFVAERGGEVAGCFLLKPNPPGPGSHVANASYVVHADCRGRGVGRAMGERSLEIARRLGFEAMQFTSKLQTNRVARGHSRPLRWLLGAAPDERCSPPTVRRGPPRNVA